jgi:uncharacterized protein YjbJ (UPF0337 family)
MATAINEDILSGKWKQLQGKVRQWWGKLTDDDMTRINGQVEELIGAVQERYGYTKGQAENEVARFMGQLK